MASKRELSLLLSQGRKGTATEKTSGASASGSKVLKVQPLQEVPTAKRQRTEVSEVPSSVDPASSSGPSSAPGAASGGDGSLPAGSFASPSFSGAGMPLPVPAAIDARLIDEDKAAYLKGFPPSSLFKQLKGMAVYTASVLKYFETGGSLEQALSLEKDRLRLLAEKKVGRMKESMEAEKEALKKDKEAAQAEADEATRALKEKEVELTASVEEARMAKEQATKLAEDLAAKNEALVALEAKLAAETAEKDKFKEAVREAALTSWVNAQEQLQLGCPGIDFSWMAADGFVEDGTYWRFNEEGELVKAPYPGSS